MGNEGTSDGEGKKLVPESDLLAIKKGLGEQLDRAKAELEATKKAADDHYQNLLTERASKEEIQKSLQTAQEAAKSLEQLKAELEAAKKGSEQSTKALLDFRRQYLINLYNVPKDAVEGKGQQELDSLEQALKIVGAKRGSGIDTGAGGGAKAPTTAREKITAGLEKLHKT